MSAQRLENSMRTHTAIAPESPAAVAVWQGILKSRSGGLQTWLTYCSSELFGLGLPTIHRQHCSPQGLPVSLRPAVACILPSLTNCTWACPILISVFVVNSRTDEKFQFIFFKQPIKLQNNPIAVLNHIWRKKIKVVQSNLWLNSGLSRSGRSLLSLCWTIKLLPGLVWVPHFSFFIP